MLNSALQPGASNMRLVRPRGAARFRHLSEIIFAPKCVAAGVAQSVEQLAGSWTVRDSNLVGARIHTHPEPPSLMNIGYRGLFPRAKQPGHGAEHKTPNAEVKNVWSYTSTATVCLYSKLPGDLYLYLNMQHK
jgi:hypothetical protein